MAMQAQSWSIQALSVELGIDRRTVAKRLDGLPPVRVEGRTKFWRMADAAPLLLGHAPTEGETIASAERRKAVADAGLAELRLAEKLAHVLDVREIEKQLNPVFSAMAAKINAMPSKFGPVVCPDDPPRGRRLLEQVAQEVLAELRNVEFSDVPEAADSDEKSGNGGRRGNSYRETGRSHGGAAVSLRKASSGTPNRP